jgi:Kef-type K+ transport system membrane component KefB
MIVALIGLNQQYIDQGIYVTLVLMSLLTTLITPIVFRNWFYRKEYCSIEDKNTTEVCSIDKDET